MRRIFFTTTIITLSVISGLWTANAQNTKPFAIPEVKEWISGKGMFTPEESEIIIAKDNPSLASVAHAFSEDYEKMFSVSLPVKTSKVGKGNFILRLDKEKKLGKEGYQIDITDKVTVTANTVQGLYWATRTLLQISEQNERQSLPKGRITDYPDYPVRGFMIDCGRKFIPARYLEDLVRIMAYYKMNTLQIHLNDNGFGKFYNNEWNKVYSAFRLESDTYPGLAAPDGYYTKQEFINLQILAENNFVEIIPEIDTPAHALAFSQYRPDIGSKKYGMDHLDLFNPETYTFVDNLFKEYLEGDSPVFRGKKVHIGTDEYSNKEQKVVEKFREYTDHYIRFVESYGKQACVWGALTHADGTTPVKSENVIMGAWYNGYADPVAMIEQGYKLISVNDEDMYIVPATDYYNDYLNTEYLYNSWTPAHIGKAVFKEKHPSILGGMFAVWNDHIGNGISVKDIHHRCFPALQTVATKTWSAQEQDIPFEQFKKYRQRLSEAPGVNQAGILSKVPALIMEKDNLNAEEELPYEEIGYDYRISFDIEPVEEEKGTILFTSKDAKFYLSDPIKGLLGYERDGYLYTFPYAIRNGESTSITIEGSSTATRLYVNGHLLSNFDIEEYYVTDKLNNKQQVYKNVRTLVFPLRKAGAFLSKIHHLKIYQL